ncbi:MAG: hypothetical protein ABI718_15090 [Acidobacteriota bacterium]
MEPNEKEGPPWPLCTTPQLQELDLGYFFFDLPLLEDDFLDEDLAAFFVAIELTTFHAVRDLTVAPPWQERRSSIRRNLNSI